MGDKYQTKISDSKSWVFSLRHFTKQNSEQKEAIKSEQFSSKETQYVIAATFDKWLALRLIDVGKVSWNSFANMKMTMPVVNSFIEFDKQFKPINMVLAYFDGSIDYSPWDRIPKYYSVQIQAGKKRELKQTLPEVVKQVQRPAYINLILDESDNMEEAFMSETICFLHKKGQHIYAINFKGQLKIMKVTEEENKFTMIEKFRFQKWVVQTRILSKYNEQNYDNQSILIAICFQNLTTPYLLQISDKTTLQEVRLKIQTINSNIALQSKQNYQNVKHICYDPNTDNLITCTQKNQIQIYTLEKVNFQRNYSIFIPQIEKIFQLQSKDSIQTVNDLSVRNHQLLILCSKSFYLYDIGQGIIVKEGQKLKETLDIGKLIALTPENDKPIILIKKKFNCLDPKSKTSTTLHLYVGK